MNAPSPIVLALVAIVLAAATLQATGRRVPGCWLLVLFSAALCGGILQDLSRGVKHLGLATVEMDHRFLVFCLFLLALSLIAALRANWRWLFWSAWILCAFVCAILIDFFFFFRLFN